MALSQYLLLRILLKKCMQLKIYHVICSYVSVWFAIGNKKDACLLKAVMIESIILMVQNILLHILN